MEGEYVFIPVSCKANGNNWVVLKTSQQSSWGGGVQGIIST